MAAVSLEVVSETDLGGIPSAMPKVADGLVIVEVAGAKMLRRFDPADPVRFDFALFGAGIDRRLTL